MKRQILITFFLLGAALYASAQQEPMFSQYMFNPLSVNPAYAGSHDLVSMTGIYRNQWVGIPGAPVSETLSLDMPVADKKVGLGFQIYNDELGVTHNTGLFVSYAYHIRINREARLSLGIQGGVTHYTADLNNIALGSNTVDQGFVVSPNVWLPNLGAGIYFSTSDWYVGAAVPHVLSTSFMYSTPGAIEYKHYFFTAGYVFQASDDVVIKPSLLVKAVQAAPIEVDFNTNVWFYNVFSIGFSYRTGDAIVGMFELQLNNQLRIGYSYDYTISELSNYNSGSHELMVRYELGYVKKKILSPRYF